eukprot:CAMPEP_0179983548 /NCGR_PEP_ID=MMETSP0984-20121128/619_1 /TAXON_ID=483367 /ORGANISM="non described non described, Strain CCMP 2436" /LENGTH=435 /DNA_ID=CAMNT_0021901997 /DNA_START=880 /DNA_END=2188 /DNA_ORIENTATION=-
MTIAFHILTAGAAPPPGAALVFRAHPGARSGPSRVRRHRAPAPWPFCARAPVAAPNAYPRPSAAAPARRDGRSRAAALARPACAPPPSRAAPPPSAATPARAALARGGADWPRPAMIESLVRPLLTLGDAERAVVTASSATAAMRAAEGRSARPPVEQPHNGKDTRRRSTLTEHEQWRTRTRTSNAAGSSRPSRWWACSAARSSTRPYRPRCQGAGRRPASAAAARAASGRTPVGAGSRRCPYLRGSSLRARSRASRSPLAAGALATRAPALLLPRRDPLRKARRARWAARAALWDKRVDGEDFSRLYGYSLEFWEPAAESLAGLAGAGSLGAGGWSLPVSICLLCRAECARGAERLLRALHADYLNRGSGATLGTGAYGDFLNKGFKFSAERPSLECSISHVVLNTPLPYFGGPSIELHAAGIVIELGGGSGGG